MARFQISSEIFAHLLDLPEGAEMGEITRVPIGSGQSVYQVRVDGGGFPDGAEMIELVYEEQDGRTSLVGFHSAE